jgi:FtsH-binding integral membrane protein
MSEYVLDRHGGWIAAEAPAAARVAFIKRTYMHLALAIAAFAGLSALLLSIPGIENIFGSIFSTKWGALGVVGGFMVVSWIADRWAHSDTSPAVQYAGLGLYVVAETLFFSPLLWIASTFPRFEGVIPQAALATAGVVAGLTLTVLITRQDFSFLRPILSICFCLAFALILGSMFLPITLGLVFSFAMVALASGAILYQTSNVLHHYRTDQHVGAALSLFAAVALLFWYILQIFMRSRD